MSVSGNPKAFDNQVQHMAQMAVEPLHPDLEPWVEEDGPLGGSMLRHPLVYDMTVDLMPGHANHAYARKKELLFEALAESDWHTAVFLYERPYRLEALIDTLTGRYEDGSIIPLEPSTKQDTLDLVADVWVDSENIEQRLDDWRALFGDCDFFLGTEAERAAFDALPDPIPAFRAGIDDGDWSWSTKRSIAEFFAQRLRDEPVPVVKALIPKSRCFGYLTRRGEHELLVRLDE